MKYLSSYDIPFFGSRRGKPNVGLIVFGLAIALVIGVLIPAGFETLQDSSGARIIYGVLVLVSLSFIGLSVVKYGVIGLVSPLSATMIGYIWFFSIGPLFSQQNAGYFYSNPSRYLPVASLVFASILLFAVGFAAASVFSQRLRTVRSDSVLDYHRLELLQLTLLVAFIVLVLFVSFLLRVNPVRFLLESGYSRTSLTVYQLAYQNSLATYPYQLWRYILIAMGPVAGGILSRRERSRLGTVVSLLSLMLVLGFSSAHGSRFILLYSIGSAIIVFFISSVPDVKSLHLRNIFSSKLLLIVAALILVGFVTMQMVGQRQSGTLVTAIASEQSLSGVGDAFDSGSDQNPFLEATLQIVPEKQGFLLGKSYVSVLTLFVPGSLWSGKPLDVASYIWTYGPFLISNISVSNVGELYANFGYLGVVVGMWLFGVAGFLLWSWLLSNRHVPAVVMMYGLVPASFAFLVRGSFSTAVAAWLYPSLLLALILGLSRVHVSRRS